MNTQRTTRAGKRIRVGEQEIIPVGAPSHGLRDLYHLSLTVSWPIFLACLGIAHLALNTLFALLYLAPGDAIANARPGSFADAFFFSVETLATVGYGNMNPQTYYGHVVATVEIFTGMISVAMTTGLIFGRFARARARILFSRPMVVTLFDDQPTLMFRLANQRHNEIIEASVRLRLVRRELTREGIEMRRIHDLALLRQQTPVFSLSWTVMHPITPDSPLFGETAPSLKAADALFVVTVEGMDETFAQNVHARHNYVADDIAWNQRFADVLQVVEGGQRYLDYHRFHDVLPSTPGRMPEH